MDDNKLLDIVKSASSIEELLINNSDEKILFQLSPVRGNVIEWFEFNENASVLEIGAGCGAITNVLCKNAHAVVAWEENADYLCVNEYINKKYSNITFVGGDISNISGTYDYIVIASTDSYKYMTNLKTILKFLREKGTLIFAFDNKYGVRNMLGIDIKRQDTYLSEGIIKQQLIDVLDDLGLKNRAWYYPIPDYKLPTEVYAEEYLPIGNIVTSVSPSYLGKRLDLYNEVDAFDKICKDGMFREFANSYIIVAN